MRCKNALCAAVIACAVVGSPAVVHAQAGAALGMTSTKLQNRTMQATLMRDGRRTIETIAGTYEGPTENFVIVVPVPVAVTKENVSTLVHKEFERIDAFASPHLDELWERDPCAPAGDAAAPAPSASVPHPAPPVSADGGAVKVESQFVSAEYDVSVLSAADSADLETWIKGQKLVLPDGAAADLAPYVKAGWHVVVAKVNVMKVFFVHNHGLLSPLRIVFDTDEFELPLRPALMNSPGGQDLVINILARGQRYEPASYASILADTNIEVNDAAKAQFAPFHEAMIERALARSPRGIVTEFAGPVTVCDACLTPSISSAEMLSFGADVVPPPPNGDRTSGFVLTRLHTRYAPEGIVGDLVLRPAPPIAGGREVRAADGEFEKGAHPSDANDFRTRYVVRHPWTGNVACTEPHRGTWGGYPGGALPAPMVAHSIGLVGPTKMDLGVFLREDVPNLDLHPVTLPTPPPDPTPPEPATSDAPTTSRSGCGSCAVGGGAVEGAWWWAVAAAALIVGRRAPRQRRRSGYSSP